MSIGSLIIKHHLLLWLAVPIYWAAQASLLKMALNSHAQKVNGQTPEVYPIQYFLGMMIQLVPLIVAALARNDAFTLGTRIPLLVCVLICYAMVTDNDGKFEWHEYGTPLMVFLVVTTLTFMAWTQFPQVQQFMAHHKTVFGILAAATMVLHILFGQGATMRKLWKMGAENQSRLRGLDLQFCRLAGFALPATHYWFSYGGTDPFTIVSIAGGSGSLVIIFLYLRLKPAARSA